MFFNFSSQTIYVSLTRLADEIDRDADGDSIVICCIGDVTVEFVCVGVSIIEGLPNAPLPGAAKLLFEYKSRC